MKQTSILALFLALILISCEQSEPRDFGRNGNEVLFSGRIWDVKSGFNGPGPNFFSDHVDDIYVDDEGLLHMHITERDGTWYSTEVVSRDTMGYGTYTFTVEGDFVGMPENTVVGLFTWDNNTFFEQANSEVDIEFSKWGDDKENTLQYGVQPIAFGDYNEERVFNPPNVAELEGITTHMFNWTDTLITWKSFTGETTNESAKFAEWTFDLDNPARIKYENNMESLPIIIPAPGNTTNARINFWILTFLEAGPIGGQRQEYIVHSFEYEPA
ncbi:MAG: hypothetical protein HKO93_01765 [Flavobacteriales bacterium]|nr:hypothetical protein [Flavobacteriales bacterium]